MKTKVFFLASLLSLFISCKPSTDDAVNYNDKIVNEQILVASTIDSLNVLISNKDTTHIKNYYKELLHTIKTSSNKIDSIKDFDNQPDYNNNIKKLFKVYQDVIDNEYKNLINVCYLSDSSITKDTFNYFNFTLNQITEKISKQMKEFNTFQENFAKKYNFSLVEKK